MINMNGELVVELRVKSSVLLFTIDFQWSWRPVELLLGSFSKHDGDVS